MEEEFITPQQFFSRLVDLTHHLLVALKQSHRSKISCSASTEWGSTFSSQSSTSNWVIKPTSVSIEPKAITIRIVELTKRKKGANIATCQTAAVCSFFLSLFHSQLISELAIASQPASFMFFLSLLVDLANNHFVDQKFRNRYMLLCWPNELFLVRSTNKQMNELCIVPNKN